MSNEAVLQANVAAPQHTHAHGEDHHHEHHHHETFISKYVLAWIIK